MSKIKFSMLVSFILIFTLFTSCNSNKDTIEANNSKISIELGNSSKEISFSFSSLPQEKKERIWKNIKSEYQYKVGGLEDTILYFPTRIKTDSLNNIYILDSKDCCVKKFDKDGRYLYQIGKKGKGPGEFMSPSKFDVRPNGKVAILDPNLNKCEVFDKDSTYLINCRFNPIDISFISEEEVVFLQIISVIKDSFLRKYNYKTNQLTEFQNIVDIKKHKELVLGAFPPLQGYILNINRKILYIPKFISLFLLYDNNGEIENGFSTMNNKDMKILEKKSFGMTDFRIPNEFRSLINAIIVDNKLMIWDYSKTIENKKPSFDFYDPSNGKYLYSIQIELKDRDTKISTIHFTKTNFYVLNDKTELEVYKYKYL